MSHLPVRSGRSREFRLTAAEFKQLSEMPAVTEWFANLDNPQTRRAYRADIRDFCFFTGIERPEQFTEVTRAHVLAWRTELETRCLAGATLRRKLAALASMFDYLLERNALAFNPVDGVKRPKVESNEGKTPALSDPQARALLEAPPSNTIKGLRDRAILSVLLYHGLRREEVARLRIEDIQERRGIKHLRVHGKGNKIRYLPMHPAALERIYSYLEMAGHPLNGDEPLFPPLRGRLTGVGLSADGVYSIVCDYAKAAGVHIPGLGVHGLRATAATNALENKADISKVQQWLGHANISTTRLYDRRQSRPEDSPSYKVRY